MAPSGGRPRNSLLEATVAAQHDDTPHTDLDLPATDETEAPPLSRRDRRAAARGKGPTQKVHGPAATPLTPPPAKARNYAARKGG